MICYLGECGYCVYKLFFDDFNLMYIDVIFNIIGLGLVLFNFDRFCYQIDMFYKVGWIVVKLFIFFILNIYLLWMLFKWLFMNVFMLDLIRVVVDKNEIII